MIHTMLCKLFGLDKPRPVTRILRARFRPQVEVLEGRVVPASPVGVDGLIGPEWAGVTPTVVPYNGGASPDGQLVGFNVYVRKDASFLYIAAQALPGTNPSGWVTASTLSLGSSANLYLDTDVASNAGSDLVFLPLGGPTFSHAYGDPNLNKEFNMDARPADLVTAGTEGSIGDGVHAGTMTGGVREFAISWKFLETDPDHVPFPVLTPTNPVVNVRTIQAFGYNFSGSQFASRFGSVFDPNFLPPSPSPIHITSLIVQPTTIPKGAPVLFKMSFSDQNPAQKHTVIINWGDGTAQTIANLNSGVVGVVLTAHSYGKTGIYSLTVRVNDAQGAFTARTVKITVNNSPLPDNFFPRPFPVLGATFGGALPSMANSINGQDMHSVFPNTPKGKLPNAPQAPKPPALDGLAP